MPRSSDDSGLMTNHRSEDAGHDAPGGDDLIELERLLWTNDPAIYAATYLPEAILIFEGVGRIDTGDAVAAIRREVATGRHWAQVGFREIELLEVEGIGTVLSYVARARWNDEAEASDYWCTTVYVRRDASWRIVAHQQTYA